MSLLRDRCSEKEYMKLRRRVARVARIRSRVVSWREARLLSSSIISINLSVQSEVN